MFGSKRRSKNSRAEPIGILLSSDGEAIFPDGYVTLSSSEEVRRCAHIIADTVSNMTIMLMKNGVNGDERVKNELSKKLDIYPSANMTRKTFIYGIVQEMVLSGNAVVLPTVSGNGFISGCSFGFYPIEESYEERNGEFHWTVEKADMHEVSVCTFPAYPQTEISARKADFDKDLNKFIRQKKAELKKRLEEIKC